MSTIQNEDCKSFVKDKMVIISSFASHMNSVTTTQPYCYSTNATIDKWKWMFSNITLFENTGNGPDPS